MSRRSNRWIVEAAIPFASLVPDPPQKGTAWGFNVGRNESPHGETSTWSPLAGTGLFLPSQPSRGKTLRVAFSPRFRLAAQWIMLHIPPLTGLSSVVFNER